MKKSKITSIKNSSTPLLDEKDPNHQNYKEIKNKSYTA